MTSDQMRAALDAAKPKAFVRRAKKISLSEIAASISVGQTADLVFPPFQYRSASGAKHALSSAPYTPRTVRTNPRPYAIQPSGM